MILANFPELPSGTHSGSQGKLTCAPLIFEKGRQICMCVQRIEASQNPLLPYTEMTSQADITHCRSVSSLSRGSKPSLRACLELATFIALKLWWEIKFQINNIFFSYPQHPTGTKFLQFQLPWRDLSNNFHSYHGTSRSETTAKGRGIKHGFRSTYILVEVCSF